MKLLLFIVSIYFILDAPFSIATAAAPAPIPQTGQVTCYNESGATIACTGTGQDSELKMGVAWPSPRFVDNSIASSTDKTVTDKLTGLIWTKDANLMKTRDPSFDSDGTAQDGAVTWQHALDYIKKLNTENYLGHKDWRLPNINEIKSLFNQRQTSSAIWLNGQGFTNVQSDAYCSGSTNANRTNYAWHVSMNYGIVGYGNKTYDDYVWPVRSGQSGAFGSLQLSKTDQTTCYDTVGTVISCSGTGQDGELQVGAAWPSQRFLDNGDQTMTDKLTGLIWSKDSNPAGGYKTWQGALDYIKTLNNSNYLGHSDWRLPNRNELESMVNRGQTSSANWLNSQGISNVQSSYYWSGSTGADSTDGAWSVDMGSGYVGNVYKTSSYYVWPVRSGQSGSFGSLALSSAATTFAATNSGTQSAPTTLTLTNGGAAAVAVSATTITGTDATQFTVATGGSAPCASLTPTLAAGASCTLNVTFAPTSAGSKSAALQITSNDLVNPTIKSDLTGTAVVPVNGVCGTSDKQTLTAKPTGNLCTSGTVTTVSGSGPWNWSCAGSNGGTTASCSAAIASYTVTATGGTGGSITPATRTINYGATTTFTVTANAGSTTSEVSGCGGSLSGTTYTTSAITTDCTVTALFGTNQYAISATVTGGNGAVSCTNPVNYGATSTCAITPASGYRVATFTDNGTDKKSSVTGNSYSIANAIANHTITATFELIPDTTAPTVAITTPVNGTSSDSLIDITGTSSDNAGGSGVSKAEVQIFNTTTQRYVSGASFTTTATWVLATTSDNWKNWQLDTSNMAVNNLTSSANGSYTITARAIDGSGNFSTPAVVSFTRGNGTGSGTTMLLVAKSEAAAGTVSSSLTGISCDTLCGATGASYNTGASVILTATPAAGYYFLNWSNCDNPNTNVCTVSVSTNHPTVTANFNKKSVTTLSLTPHTQTLTLNLNQTVSGRLATLPDLPSADLNNQTISVTIKGPDGQQALDTKTTDNNGTWSLPLSLFTKKGTYFISASYAGAEKMMSSSSDIATILVAKSAGYAIIVHGKINNNEGLLDHLHTTDMIKEKLIQRLFLDEDITYLKSSATTAPSKTDVQNAITTWAKNKLNTSPAPLVVVLVDHGDPSQFHIGNDYITPQDLAGWMTTLDSSLTADARAENQIVVIGTCYSGSFIPALSRQGRIIITSADATEQSIRGTMVGYADDKTTKIRQGEAFLEELFSRLGSGKYLGDAFKQAVDALTPKVPRITNGTNSNFGDKFTQHPLLDADGDGKGSYLLDGTSDGVAIAKLVTGEGAFNAGSYPADITSATATQYLQSYETSDLLWLKSDQDSRIGSAWIEIRKPDTTINSSGTGQVILDLETITLTHNSSAGRWETTYNGFTIPGTYEIYYYTQDSQTGDISPMVRSLVYKNKTGNNSPAAFNLTNPTNISSQKTVLVLGWQQSSDPDNNPFTYTIQISRDSTFSSIDYQLEEITDSQVAIASDAGLTDNTTYYWRVIAIDQYGALKYSTENWSFTTDNTNGLPGIIKGYLRSSSGVPISGAKVAIGTVSTTTQSNGAFMTTAPTGSYTVTATATGYQQKSVMVTATAGKIVDAGMSLIAATTAGKAGDCDNSGTVTIAEVQSAINMFLGLKTVEACVDIDSSNSVSIAEVQKVINSFLGL